MMQSQFFAPITTGGKTMAGAGAGAGGAAGPAALGASGCVTEAGSAAGGFVSGGPWLTVWMGDVPAPFLFFLAGSDQAKGSVGFTLVPS
jgi:hypothetical protein